MRNQTQSFFLLFISMLFLLPELHAADVRIGWDFRSYKNFKYYNISNKPGVTGDNSHYPRTKRLNNGDLLMVFMDGQLGWTIYSRKSTDDGLTWSDAYCVREPYKDAAKGNDDVCFACPDFLELPDGTILLVYHWRYNNGFNDYPNTNKNCGIEMIKSVDHGATFDLSTARRIYSGRNWEPSLLQLPTGEIQMFFTDSHTQVQKTAGIRPIPAVGMLRSFDNGNTWQPEYNPESPSTVHISRSLEGTEDYKDGMPVGQYLHNDKGIAVALERDGGTQTPWIVWSSKDANWNYTDFTGLQQLGPGLDRKWPVHKDLRGFAPYMAKLPTGEILVQSNGKYKSEDGLWLLIGDEEAKNFDHASKVFRNVNAWWGSVAYIGKNQIFSSGNVGYDTGDKKREILVTKGYINRKMVLDKKELPEASLAGFDKTDGTSWFVGNLCQQQYFLQMAYTDNYLHIKAYVYDRKVNAYTIKDAVQLLLFRAKKTYRMTFDVQGKITLEAQSGPSSFTEIALTGASLAVSIDGTLNNNADTDNGFILDARIPWTLIGNPPTAGEICRMHPKMFINDAGSSDPGAVIDEMCGQQESTPNSWLSFELGTGTGIPSMKIPSFDYSIAGGILRVTSSTVISRLAVYDMMGKPVFPERICNASSCNINISGVSRGIYLIRLIDGEGRGCIRKVWIG